MPSLYDSGSLLAVPVGGTIPVPATGVPAGYLLCDGSALSKTVYAALFAAIGVTHGEPTIGGATFNIPDYRGRFLRGLDNSTGRDPDRASRMVMNLNGLVGDNIGTIQGAAFTAHQHSTGIGHENESGAPYPFGTFTGALVNMLDSIGANMSAHVLTQNVGGNETRPLNASTNFMIRFR